MPEVDVYIARLRFDRLFADPLIFENTVELPQRYLVYAGVPKDKADRLRLMSRDVAPVDDSGRPSIVGGSAGYYHQGKRVRSEYVKDANLDLEYADFGSGLSPEDHERIWRKGVWGEMKFQVKAFQHQKAPVGLPDLTELYQMLRSRADPTTLASVELTGVSEKLFHATLGYLEHRMRKLAEEDGMDVEVYNARALTPSEKVALETRIGRASSTSTVHIILSKRTVP